jgi:hypothetical protein
MRLRLLALTVALAAAIAVTASPASAVTGNFQPDYQHTYVGLVVFYDADGNFLWRCSGSLLNEWTFLTAGHCADIADGAVSARIYFQQDAGANYNPELGYDPTTGYPLSCIPEDDPLCVTSHTLYSYGFSGLTIPQTYDIGLLILDEPVYLDHYASLAQAGSLDQLATQRGRQNETFTITGYGISGVKPRALSYRSRLMATAQLINLRSALNAGFNIQLTTNPGGGKGGTCFGDSGGPILYDSTDIIVAVNSFVSNLQCAGVSYGYRTDQQAVIDWILAHAKGDVNVVPLPI